MVCRLVFVSFVLFGFVGLASAQTPLPQPVNRLPIGFMDGKRQDPDALRLVGWALDQDAPAANLPVHFWTRDSAGEMKFVGVAWTSTLRQDVNNAYGVTGTHGWEFAVPASLCDNTDKPVYGFAIDVNDATQAKILAMAPTMVTCAPPLPIQGFVIDEFGAPLPSQGWYGTNVTLQRISSSEPSVWVASTDCQTGNGCVDINGGFQFFGAFEEAKYRMTVKANRRIVSRQEFYYSTKWGAYVANVLKVMPVYGEMISWDPTIAGGIMRGTMNLCNYSSTDWVAAQNVVVYGPGKSTEFTSYEVQSYVWLPARGTCDTREVTLFINDDLPDGEYFFAQVKIGNLARLDDVYSEAWFWAVKGITVSPEIALAAAKGSTTLPPEVAKARAAMKMN